MPDLILSFQVYLPLSSRNRHFHSELLATWLVFHTGFCMCWLCASTTTTSRWALHPWHIRPALWPRPLQQDWRAWAQAATVLATSLQAGQEQSLIVKIQETDVLRVRSAGLSASVIYFQAPFRGCPLLTHQRSSLWPEPSLPQTVLTGPCPAPFSGSQACS